MTPALEAICAQLITPLAELMDEVRRTEAGLVFVPHADVAANQYPDAANRYLKQMMETCSFIQKLLEEIHKLAFVESRSAVASASANVSELLRAVSSLVHDYKSLASIRPSEQLKRVHELLLISASHEILRLDGVRVALEQIANYDAPTDWVDILIGIVGFGREFITPAVNEAYEAERKSYNKVCFIATAAYGSADHRHVVALRRFRDRYLMPYRFGRLGVACYYNISPAFARAIARHRILRCATRGLLFPVARLVERIR